MEKKQLVVLLVSDQTIPNIQFSKWIKLLVKMLLLPLLHGMVTTTKMLLSSLKN